MISAATSRQSAAIIAHSEQTTCCLYYQSSNRKGSDSYMSGCLTRMPSSPNRSPAKFSLEALLAHLITPFHGPVPPSNLLDMICFNPVLHPPWPQKSLTYTVPEVWTPCFVNACRQIFFHEKSLAAPTRQYSRWRSWTDMRQKIRPFAAEFDPAWSYAVAKSGTTRTRTTDSYVLGEREIHLFFTAILTLATDISKRAFPRLQADPL